MALTTNKYLMTSDGGAANAKTTGGATAIAAGAVGGINRIGATKGSGKGGTTTGKIDTPIDNTPVNTFDWGAYYSELQRQAQARANEAYERNMQRIANAYGSAYNSLTGNYDSTVSRLNAARDKSMGDVRSDAEDSLRQAYINNMMTKRSLNQRLSALGYNGGATETTMSSLENQYGKSRTGINETLNKNISDLNATYGDNLAAALQSFNSAKANLDLQRMQLEMQAENARNNAESSSMSAYMNIDGSYLSALQNALSKQAQYQYNPSQATNDFVAGNATQGDGGGATGSNYAKYLAQAQLDASNGMSANAIKNKLYNAVSQNGLDINSLYYILEQLRMG